MNVGCSREWVDHAYVGYAADSYIDREHVVDTNIDN